MKILAIDIETSPNLAHVWDLWNQNVGLAQLREASELLCFSACWVDSPSNMLFYSQWDDGDGMVDEAHKLLNEADAVLHYNGKSFDIPYLNKEFVIRGYLPPSPYAQIDLYTTIKKRFRFPSYKLAYVSKELGFVGKINHEGHELWVKVLKGDEQGRLDMKNYNIRDTQLLVDMYEKLLPWIPNHPNKVLIDNLDQRNCSACGSARMIERDACYSALSKFKQWQCLKCGTWSRETKRAEGTALRGVTW